MGSILNSQTLKHLLSHHVLLTCRCHLISHYRVLLCHYLRAHRFFPLNHHSAKVGSRLVFWCLGRFSKGELEFEMLDAAVRFIWIYVVTLLTRLRTRIVLLNIFSNLLLQLAIMLCSSLQGLWLYEHLVLVVLEGHLGGSER
jgi:hypothetical protein